MYVYENIPKAGTLLALSITDQGYSAYISKVTPRQNSPAVLVCTVSKAPKETYWIITPTTALKFGCTWESRGELWKYWCHIPHPVFVMELGWKTAWSLGVLKAPQLNLMCKWGWDLLEALGKLCMQEASQVPVMLRGVWKHSYALDTL